MKNVIIFSLGILLTFFLVEKTFAQPANDLCAGSVLVTPDGTCVGGTTVAANDNWTGAVGCQSGGGTHEDVWYQFVATGSILSGTVTTAAPWLGDVEFVLVSSTGGCAGPFTLVGSNCGPSPLTLNITGLTIGATYYFTISPTNAGTPGPFTVCPLTSSPPVNCTDNDDCATPTNIPFTTGTQTCLTDCNTGANVGPDFSGNNCYDFTDETVWYSVTTTASNASIDVLITSAALTSPFFTIFTTSDCLNYTIVNCTEGAIGSGTASATTIMVAANTTYLIAISDQAGAAGNFDLCVTVNDDNSACNTNNSLNITATSMGSPLTGPYQPGEIVSFCYTITAYDPGLNCNYLQGIVPTFGDCWDPVSFDAQGKPVNITTPLVTAGIIQACAPGPPCAWSACVGTSAGTWSWFPAGAVTYNNIVGSLPPLSPMPAGWYFLTSYDPTTNACTPDPVDPDNSYGDNNFPYCDALDWSVCFQLQARSSSACIGGQTDCAVTIHTYADGEIGIWNNIGCTADASGAASLGTNLCCTTAPTVTSPVTYCQGSAASPLTATGTNLLWYTVPTGGVGSAIAPTPSTAVVGTTNYYVSQTSSGCESARSLIAVTIYNPPTANANTDQIICDGSTVTLAGGIGGSAVSATWTGGTGTFAPDASTLNAIYTPSAGDITAGTVTLTLTTNDPAGPCLAVNDQMVITINPPATVNANINQTICAGSTVTLAGSIGGSAVSATWTGGTGTFAPNTSTLNAIYTPSAGDITAGNVTLTLTTDDPAGPCLAVNDQMVITITPIDNASFTYSSSTYCQTGADPTATITGLGGGIFSSTAGLVFLNTSTGLIDLSASSLATYVITYTTNGPCPNTSTYNITITTSPSAAFSYSGPYCQGGVNPLPTFGPGASAGTFSSTAGLNFINVLTGEINLTTSTPGTYTVYNDIPAGGGCSAANDSNTVTINPAATVDAGPIQSICEGSNITLAGIIGGGASSASWSGGSGIYNPDANTLNAIYTPSATEITAGTVSLTLTSDDPSGPCSFVTDVVTFAIFPATGVYAGNDQIICSGSDVILQGQVSGGATSGSWTGGLGTYNPDANTLNAIYTPNASEISSGILTLTLTTDDPAGPCLAISDQIIISIDQIATVDAGADNTVCEGDIISLLGIIGGGAASSSWTGGTGTFTPDANTLNATYTPSASDIIAGSVTFTLTTNDPIGPCIAVTDQVVIDITPADDPAFSYSTATHCQSGIDPSAIITGTLGGTFTSSSGLVFLDINTGLIDLSTSTLGTYTITYTTNGPCPRTTTFDITITNAPTASFTYAGPFCQSDSVNPLPTLGVGALSGVFSSIPLGLILNSVTGQITLSTSTVGTYTVYNSVASSGGCSAALDSTVVTIDLPAIVSAGIDTSICSYNVLSLSGSIGGSATFLTWTTTGDGVFSDSSSANSTYTPSVNDISNGSVFLIITSDDPIGACNIVADSLLLFINVPPDLTMGPDTIINCSNPSIGISCSTTAPSVTYNWSGPGIVSGGNTSTPIVDQSGTYTVTVTIIGDGCFVIDSLIVGISNATPIANAGNDTSIVCASPSIVLNGSTSSTGVNFSWTGPGIISGGNTLTPSVSLSGDYILTVIDTINGCSASDTITVASGSNPPPADAGMDVAVCLGLSTQLNATGGTIYQWSPSVGLTSDTIFNPFANPLLTTVYTVLVTDSLGCSASDSVVVTVNNVPNPLITGDSSVCQGQTISYSTTVVSGNNYLWSVSGGTPTTGNNSSLNITWNILGTGNIILVETSASNCIASDTSDIIINETPVAVAGIDDSICLGDFVQISASGSTGSFPLNYIWDNGLGSGVSHSVSPLINTTYSVVVSNSFNCTSTDNVTITISPIPVFSISGINTTCSDYTDGSAQSNISSATPPIAYLWSNGLTTASINNIGKGLYYLTISDASGCFTVDSVEIKSQDLYECLEIPTVFSPNGDGKNDTWEIKHIELFPDASVEIYNRWGNLLYKADNYADPAKWWDGKFKGTDLPLGSFVYIIILSSDRDPIQGIVSIVR